MKRLPSLLGLARDVKVKDISAIIDPVLNLKNYSPMPRVGVKIWPLDNWPFLDQSIVVPDAGHEEASGPQLSPDLYCCPNELFRALQVWKRVVHADRSVEV